MSQNQQIEPNPRAVAKALRYARRLIEFDSSSMLTNKLIAQYLEMKLSKHGFLVEHLNYTDSAGVAKYCLVAKKGSGTGGLALFGHMDTVPAPNWRDSSSGPFEPVVENGRLYGRGSCDMKGPIACILAAANPIPADDLRQPLYVVLTADEETGFGGARRIAEESGFFREMVAGSVRGVICEPTMLQVVHAHKGSVMLAVTARGIAAHSSTAAGISANWQMIPFLQRLARIRHEVEQDPAWQNPDFDPPGLSFNVCLRDNSPALNVTASETVCQIYLRSLPGINIEPVVQQLRDAASSQELEFSVPRSAPPLFTDPGGEFVADALALCGQSASRTVSYGTDGAVLGELGNLIVCGPGSIEQAHTTDEWIALEQLKLGTGLYSQMIKHWCERENGNEEN